MKACRTPVLIGMVILLTAAPLWMVRRPAPGPDGKEAEIFAGADDRAKETIAAVAPRYKPWFKPIMEPPSGEVGTFLFATQAALGAGFIGYWLGCSVTRARMRRQNDPRC